MSIDIKQADYPPSNLSSWLDYIASLSPKDIDLGLERVREVYRVLKLDFSKTTVITVAGTNGKGTTCALLEKAAFTAGYSVAVYSSPFLLDYCEQLRVNTLQLNEEQHCLAFYAVEQARGDIPLTLFEFSTLAVLYLIASQNVNYALLEVGMGGDTDAVNVVDPDIAVITSIALDHGAWLGNTRESVGKHKAGIFRPNIPVFIGDPSPPESVFEAAASNTVQGFYQGKEFDYKEHSGHWDFHFENEQVFALPKPRIPLQNAATALAIVKRLKWPLSPEQFVDVLQNTLLPGRSQLIRQQPDVLLDVAHNPEAANYLYSQIRARKYDRLHLVVAMLADKDIEQCLAPFCHLNPQWYLSTLTEPRGAQASKLKSLLVRHQKVVEFDTVEESFDVALKSAQPNDLVVVFGSFITVSKILRKENSN